MISQPKYHISKKGLNVWRIHAVFEFLILLLFAAAVSVLTFFFDWPEWIYAICLGVLIADVFFGIYLFPKIRWNHWRYEVREQEIEIQQGLFIIKRTLVPMVRVQHVDTSQGPILKHYCLASMSISTAATIHTIPAITEQEADQLRVRISELARVAEDDV
ncbi:PH domain-containing protein [Rummeliibacillus suwonensis]|uniref:PH domain-containing protein n=1 Tax=Rummeliibacillus suwonensis TaxID=1306154 RepID=UPI001AAE2027|nr:PH domain-containing protein [Rummeliibacillus suwonensis]MBO2537074.1 PH domain-containing protein [Rummeliibacillus suwonensis]